MPFCYKFDLPYLRLKHYLNRPDVQQYFDVFKPTKGLYAYRMQDSFCYYLSDVDLFPPDDTDPKLTALFTPVEQEEVNTIGYNLSTYELDGDTDLLGGDDLHGLPPIIGNPN